MFAYLEGASVEVSLEPGTSMPWARHPLPDGLLMLSRSILPLCGSWREISHGEIGQKSWGSSEYCETITQLLNSCCAKEIVIPQDIVIKVGMSHCCLSWDSLVWGFQFTFKCNFLLICSSQYSKKVFHLQLDRVYRMGNVHEDLCPPNCFSKSLPVFGLWGFTGFKHTWETWTGIHHFYICDVY